MTLKMFEFIDEVINNLENREIELENIAINIKRLSNVMLRLTASARCHRLQTPRAPLRQSSAKRTSLRITITMPTKSSLRITL